MASALARSSAGSVTSSRPGARSPLIEDSASHASSLSRPRTVQRVARTSCDPPRCSAERRYGSMTFEIVSSGFFTLVMMPSARWPASVADLGPPAAMSIGTGCVGGEYSRAVSVV